MAKHEVKVTAMPFVRLDSGLLGILNGTEDIAH
jgi:hypothetical protein